MTTPERTTVVERPPTPTRATSQSYRIEPTWDVAYLFPDQGNWSEEEYLALDTNHLIEYSHGRLEVLEMPTQSHQFFLLHLYRLLLAFVEQRNLGVVLTAAMPVQLWPGKYREPDILFMAAEHASRRQEQYWEGADLVMEVVSDHDRRRDLTTKRQEYARAGIPEYWIVDPRRSQITVLALQGGSYIVHGHFSPGSQATSVLLPGFAVDVAAIFAARL